MTSSYVVIPHQQWMLDEGFMLKVSARRPCR